MSLALKPWVMLVLMAAIVVPLSRAILRTVPARVAFRLSRPAPMWLQLTCMVGFLGSVWSALVLLGLYGP